MDEQANDVRVMVHEPQWFWLNVNLGLVIEAGGGGLLVCFLKSDKTSLVKMKFMVPDFYFAIVSFLKLSLSFDCVSIVY